ncbi:cysteine--tRNA ligase [Dermacoccaceae bacterium W4C1]
MSLRIYDTATREQREFVPLVPGQVGIYICGLTTQASPHIGHLRFTVAFDILRRWLTEGHGYQVRLVRNVTDIDDKILAKSAEAEQDWAAWSYRFERETTAALNTLGVLPPSYEPRATGHVPDMVELMELLIERGHAYPAPDGSGDVYFDVKSWSEYGQLTRQNLDDMEAATDADPRGKRDARDFALWKGRKDAEPTTASWPTPFGPGRPGWHLECSAMARRWLGDAFDIHGGGIDLRFPHHENEQAQSRAAGLGFAQYWMHNGMLTLAGEKMSKSIGNTLTVDELTKTVRPLTLRFFLGAAHYRSSLEYHEGSLAEAEAAVQRIEALLARTGVTEAAPEFPPAFAAAMDDDLNVSGALAVIFDTVRAGNTAADASDTVAAELAAAQVIRMTSVLGVNPLDPQWSSPSDAGAEGALGALVEDLVAQRRAARAEKDFATADRIRDQLAGAGVQVDDTQDGVRWSLARN